MAHLHAPTMYCFINSPLQFTTLWGFCAIYFSDEIVFLGGLAMSPSSTTSLFCSTWQPSPSCAIGSSMTSASGSMVSPTFPRMTGFHNCPFLGAGEDLAFNIRMLTICVHVDRKNIPIYTFWRESGETSLLYNTQNKWLKNNMSFSARNGLGGSFPGVYSIRLHSVMKVVDLCSTTMFATRSSTTWWFRWRNILTSNESSHVVLARNTFTSRLGNINVSKTTGDE